MSIINGILVVSFSANQTAVYHWHSRYFTFTQINRGKIKFLPASVAEHFWKDIQARHWQQGVNSKFFPYYLIARCQCSFYFIFFFYEKVLFISSACISLDRIFWQLISALLIDFKTTSDSLCVKSVYNCGWEPLC